MPFDIAALAQAGAQVIVAAMATETWSQVRVRVGRLFGRGDEPGQQQAFDDLDEVQANLRSDPTDTAAHDAEVELRTLVKARLRSDPELAAQFAALVDELANEVRGTRSTTVVDQRGHANHGGTVIQAGRDVSTYLRPPGEPRGWQQD